MVKSLAVLAVVGLATAANAQVVINADITNSSGIGNITTGGNTNGNPAAWTYWTFSAAAGDNINVEVNRLVAELDPIAAVYQGNMAGAAYSGTITDSTLMGFSLVAFGDDNDGANVPGGPWGDPNFSFSAPVTGVYTICVSSYASAGIPSTGYLHEVFVRGSSVPAPGAAALVALGGIFAARRRRA